MQSHKYEGYGKFNQQSGIWIFQISIKNHIFSFTPYCKVEENHVPLFLSSSSVRFTKNIKNILNMKFLDRLSRFLNDKHGAKFPVRVFLQVWYIRLDREFRCLLQERLFPHPPPHRSSRTALSCTYNINSSMSLSLSAWEWYNSLNLYLTIKYSTLFQNIFFSVY